MRARRTVLAVLGALALTVSTVSTSLAAVAEQAPPDLDWTVAPGFPVVYNDATVTIETAVVGSADLPTPEPHPIQRINIVNDSAQTRYFSFGIDVDEQSVIEPLWLDETFAGTGAGGGIPLVVTLSPGEQLADIPGHMLYYGISTEMPGVPVFPGRTEVVYELSDDPADNPDPTATEIGRLSTPGGFVPIHFDQPPTPEGTVPVGVPLTVVGPSGGGEVELFPGITAEATASDLPANLDVELWLVPDVDYFSFIALGSPLLGSVARVGTATTSAGGTLATAFTVPADVDVDVEYHLFAGVPGDRYWPAGTDRAFTITPPVVSDAVSAAIDDTQATLQLGTTSVELGFPVGMGGEWSAAASTTGPAVGDFTVMGDPALHYHLDTDAALTEPITVCITYPAESFPGDPPRLFHHFPTAPDGLFRWVDITTDPQPGRVCGETASLSPFALGYPIDDGSVTPPAKGVLHSDNGWDTGLLDGEYNIVMDLPSGENARTVRLLEGGIVIAQQTLTFDSPNPQQATFPITGRRNGTFTYSAELENSRGVTKTRPITVEVTHATPSKPVLQATAPSAGSFTVRASMPWGTNATGYRFLQNDVEVASGTLVAASPEAQYATLTRSGLPKGTYTYVVEFTNHAGTTASSPLTVKVQ